MFSMSNIQLHWVQLHVSALCIGHHQVLLAQGYAIHYYKDETSSPPKYPAYCIVAQQGSKDNLMMANTQGRNM